MTHSRWGATPQVEALYWRLKDQEVKENETTRRLRVFWDKECLVDGQEWEQGFCNALCSSSVFVPVMSRDAFKKGPLAHMPLHQEEDDPLEPAKCDNLFLEFELALVLVPPLTKFSLSLSVLPPPPPSPPPPTPPPLSLWVQYIFSRLLARSLSSPTPTLRLCLMVFPYFHTGSKSSRASRSCRFLSETRCVNRKPAPTQEPREAPTQEHAESERARQSDRERERERERGSLTHSTICTI